MDKEFYQLIFVGKLPERELRMPNGAIQSRKPSQAFINSYHAQCMQFYGDFDPKKSYTYVSTLTLREE